MKLVEVMACIDWVEKHGVNATQGYKYAEAADIYAAVRGELARRYIMVTPIFVDAQFEARQSKSGATGVICTVKGELRFTDTETGEVDAVPMFGQGSDSLDKALYKAMTGAMKNALMHKFLIPTGADPEHEPKQAIPAPQGLDAVKRQMGAPPAPTGMLFPNYGNAKGQPISGADLATLNFYAGGARKSLADPAKAKFHDAERRLLAAIEAEITRKARNEAHDEPPPPSDDDMPPPV